MDKRKLFEIRFPAMWLGGKAIVRAIDQDSALKALKKTYKNLDVDKCKVKELPNGDGVLYFDNGDY